MESLVSLSGAVAPNLFFAAEASLQCGHLLLQFLQLLPGAQQNGLLGFEFFPGDEIHLFKGALGCGANLLAHVRIQALDARANDGGKLLAELGKKVVGVHGAAGFRFRRIVAKSPSGLNSDSRITGHKYCFLHGVSFAPSTACLECSCCHVPAWYSAVSNKTGVEQAGMGNAFAVGWRAGLELELCRRQGVTRLTHTRHWGPLRVQRPFYPGSGSGSDECHIYVLHPPGGMVTGDSLQMDIRLVEGAHGLLTTPSAGKIYRGNSTEVGQRQNVVCLVTGGSCLEWLPQETIVFDGARGELSLHVALDDDSTCCLWDIVCLGRPASGEAFASGYLRQRLELVRNGVPLYSESNRFAGGSDMLAARWGLAGYPVCGTFLVTVSLGEEMVAQLRAMLEAQCPETDLVALSDLGGVLAIRYLGMSAEHCKQLFTACWRTLRPLVRGVAVVEPRIWRT